MASRPDLTLENRWLAAGYRPVAGCDEAGRGPLAGPVVAAAVILPPEADLPGLNDSKKLDAVTRSGLYHAIRRTALAVGVGYASPAEIDRLNILQASLLAMRRAIAGLLAPPAVVLIDGNQRLPGLACEQETVVGGDGRSRSIAAASIIAKVTRDELMGQLDRLYPGYGLAQHKGYPCPPHLAALRQLGPSPVHRTSFGPVRELLADPPPLPPAKCRGQQVQLSLFDDV
ncbi:MAG: ribonuclease HII [Fimbriimonadaceae bacterium]|nr:ribonuclease HII [Fimbriimonadaceae bacterium]